MDATIVLLIILGNAAQFSAGMARQQRGAQTARADAAQAQVLRDGAAVTVVDVTPGDVVLLKRRHGNPGRRRGVDRQGSLRQPERY
ncbi:MAG: hypothetical protein R2854_15110 [Caldilineaceae bacterium]